MFTKLFLKFIVSEASEIERWWSSTSNMYYCTWKTKKVDGTTKKFPALRAWHVPPTSQNFWCFWYDELLEQFSEHLWQTVPHDIFAAPAARAYVERGYSVCGLLTAGRRNRMTKSLQMRACLKLYKKVLANTGINAFVWTLELKLQWKWTVNKLALVLCCLADSLLRIAVNCQFKLRTKILYKNYIKI